MIDSLTKAIPFFPAQTQTPVEKCSVKAVIQPKAEGLPILSSNPETYRPKIAFLNLSDNLSADQELQELLAKLSAWKKEVDANPGLDNDQKIRINNALDKLSGHMQRFIADMSGIKDSDDKTRLINLQKKVHGLHVLLIDAYQKFSTFANRLKDEKDPAVRENIRKEMKSLRSYKERIKAQLTEISKFIKSDDNINLNSELADLKKQIDESMDSLQQLFIDFQDFDIADFEYMNKSAIYSSADSTSKTDNSFRLMEVLHKNNEKMEQYAAETMGKLLNYHANNSKEAEKVLGNWNRNYKTVGV